MNRLSEDLLGMNASVRFPVIGAVRRDAVIKGLDKGLEASLLGLLIVLPIAHVTAIRSFLIVSTGVLWVSRMAVSGDWKVRTPMDLPILLYSAAAVLSFFFAIRPLDALKEIQGELLQYLVIFYAASYVYRDEARIRLFAIVLSGWIVLFGMTGFGMLYLEGGVSDLKVVRFASLARGVTNYSDYIVLTFPLVAWVAFRMEGMKSWIGRAAVVVALITQMLTHSRAGWIAITFEVILIIYLMQRQRLIAGIVLITLVGVSGLLPPEVLFHGGQEGFRYDTREQASYSGTESIRLYQWANGAKEMLKHPFEGFGYGRKNYVAGMQAAGPGTLDVSSCNAFLDAWMQLGLQGMVALLLIFITLVVTLGKYARRVAHDERSRSFFISGLITVAGYFVANQFEGSYVDEMAITFWLLMGVFMGSVKALSKKEISC